MDEIWDWSYEKFRDWTLFFEQRASLQNQSYGTKANTEDNIPEFTGKAEDKGTYQSLTASPYFSKLPAVQNK